MLNDTLVKMGFKLKSRLTKDDFNGREGDSHWEVTISRNDCSYTTDYHQGCAYRRYRGGKKIKFPYTGGTLEQNKRTIPIEPTLTDVLYCLVSDAQCARDVSFAEWAADMGYSDDSIKAKATYDACRDCYFELRRLCDLDELSELFQDY